MPAGWVPPSNETPDLVFGVISDSHIGVWWRTGLANVRNALTYFKNKGAHAVMHCGDISDDGYVSQLKAYGEDAWDAVFPKGTTQPVKLIVTGNHDYYGGNDDKRTTTAPHEYSAKLYDNQETGNSGVIGCVRDYIDADYGEDFWHRTVAGTSHKLYHFFGYGGPEGLDSQNSLGKEMAKLISAEYGNVGWDNDAPFFIMSHIPPYYDTNTAVAAALGCANQNPKKSPEVCNKGLWLYGHGHENSSAWGNAIKVPGDACMPRVQCSLCGCKHSNGETDTPTFAKGFGDGKAEGWYLPGGDRAIDHGFLVSVYSKVVVIHRVDLKRWASDTELASLGPDWVMSLDNTLREGHPLSMAVMKVAIEAPEFPSGAKLALKWESDAVKLTIPKADGNAASRIYGYNVEVAGDGGALRKSVYASGYNVGLGYEPDDGVTVLSIPKNELPVSEHLVFRVWPCSSLGTRGDPISTSATCIVVSVDRLSGIDVNRDARFVITHGANIDEKTGVVAERLPWVKRVCVEGGEIMVETRTADDGATVRVK